MISADTFCCTVQVTRHRKDVKHFSSKRVSWHSRTQQAWEASTEPGQSVTVAPATVAPATVAPAVSLQRGAWGDGCGVGRGGAVRCCLGQPAHLEIPKELRQSQQTALTAADYEERPFCSFKTKLQWFHRCCNEINNFIQRPKLGR